MTRRTANSRPRRLRRTLLAVVLPVLLLLGGTTGWALDRFLIPHVEITDVAAHEAASQTASATPAAANSDDAESEASVTVETKTLGSGDDTVTYHVADVVVSDATQLRSAFAENQFGTNITQLVSEMAEDNGARLAINGDYYGFRDDGILIRNGVVYRDDPARTGLVIYRDGTMAIYDETETSADELLADGAWQTLSFGPALVDDGQIVEGIDEVEIDTNVGNHSVQGTHPRTAIGVIDENHFVFVVVDGRERGYSRGMSMTELAQLMQDLGATTAYNLDGGGSSELWFDGEVVNHPSNGGERATSDILYIG
ncbi:phosphodiester glycosidase family protein [Tessaracoccus caeni]|uniref:phosphodiester glycosidase family protein n=1 Tax=Tessaracoccus caeni TaxID=3031239 RepID=UPI0023DAD830|nr:phosphodiester glycosidase family protein [Tessaracoccus caeni]MDF1488897.1 phosphodiester glycosidase family protein [Tessaracoccus caeni]